MALEVVPEAKLIVGGPIVFKSVQGPGLKQGLFRHQKATGLRSKQLRWETNVSSPNPDPFSWGLEPLGSLCTQQAVYTVYTHN
jgi:hypothetical protein